MLGMIVGSTLGYRADAVRGRGDLIVGLRHIGGVLGVWAGLRFSERIF